MHPTRKSSDVKSKAKEKSKDDILPKKENEKLKKNVYSMSTPRPYLQQSTTADIYSRQNSALKAPKKSAPNLTKNNISPMKNLLKASPSLTQMKGPNVKKTVESIKSFKAFPDSARSVKIPRTAKSLPLSNVTVNSPPIRRKLISEIERKPKNTKKNISLNKSKEVNIDERQRTKTRTLDEDEVKVLTPHAVDNNAEMLNLSKKLKAQSKAFFVDLNAEQAQSPKDKEGSEEEISYEDDFESYESDFESYHSSSSNKSIPDDQSSAESEKKERVEDEFHLKEEKMLDSGTFELRDRSATKTKPMNFIVEDTNDKKVSLTDEGFQEMSSSSAVSSMKTVHLEVLERPLFIDFTKSKENRKKRRIFERLKQRAVDILSMVTLHEMSSMLFEMKPIPYDLYMATFGKANYTQIAVQTFDDGIAQEVQTEEVEYKNKWTQHPVEFSNESVCITREKTNKNNDDIFAKIENTINFDDKSLNEEIDDRYRTNHLRIYLEQKDGVGKDNILPVESYDLKVKHTDFNINKLSKFLKKVEGRLSNVLSANIGSTQISNLVGTSRFPFSNGYVSISLKNYKNRRSTIMNDTNITGVVFSETRSNLIFTLHEKCKPMGIHKSIVCLWDLNVAMLEPLKLLIATDCIEMGRFIGGTDGIFVAALKDGTIHLWDLSDETNWFGREYRNEEISNKDLMDNATRNYDQPDQLQKLQACGYTSSASSMDNNMDSLDKIVGLELTTGNTVALENGNKMIGQICILRKRGILTLYSIIQEKHKNVTHDIGKAFWSRMRLEKYQNIDLVENYVPINNKLANSLSDFNLNIAKKRLNNKRHDRSMTRDISRPKSAIKKIYNDRPNSAGRLKSVISRDSNWESGIVCSTLKIINTSNVDNYLIAKNCGEVLNCRKIAGAVKLDRFHITHDSSVITFLEESPNKGPYFLAGTDSGTIHLCSLLTSRVLLTLDCSKSPSSLAEKCQSDDKGRFVGTVAAKPKIDSNLCDSNLSVTSLVWSKNDPFYIIACTAGGRVDVWKLTHSDLHPYKMYEKTAALCTARDRHLAILNVAGDVEVYRMNTNNDEHNLEVFDRYVSLL